MVCDRVPPVLSLLLRLMNSPYAERVLAGCDFGGLVSAFDDLSFCSACVRELSTPHRIAKVEGVAGVVIVVQLEGPPRFVERVLPAGRDFGGLVFNGGRCETPT